MKDQHEADRTIRHAVQAVASAEEQRAPFLHLRLGNIFPPDVYAAMLEAMPAPEDYRRMSGRARYTRTQEGGTRTKIDLFPEYLLHLPARKKAVWKLVGRALRSSELLEAFRARLAPGIEKRHGAGNGGVPMFPVPVLTRDIAGYKIGIHTDTRWKGITVQLYLPRDRSIEHIGTVFHSRGADGRYQRALQVPFAPNSGYAFAVGADTYHSVDVVGPEVSTRDSILLTYFLDRDFVQRVSNRGKRFGNFVLNEFRTLRRLGVLP